MDLVELKETWLLFNANVISHDFVDERLINQTIHQKSKSEITGIKRAMRVKFIIGFSVLVIGIITLFAMAFNAEFNPLSSILDRQDAILFYIFTTISLGAMIVVNHRAYRQIDHLTRNPDNLKQALENFTLSMRKAISFNVYSDTFISPIFITWLYYTYAFKIASIGWNAPTIVLVILPVLIGIFGFYFARYTQYLKFGKYVERLEGYLSSLKENSENV